MQNVDTQLYEDIGALKAESKNHTKGINKLNKKSDDIIGEIKGLSVVSLELFNAYTKSTNGRLEKIEKKLLIDDSSLSGRLRVFFDNSIVRILGTALIFILFVTITYQYNGEVKKLQNIVNQKTDSSQVNVNVTD